MAAQSTTYRGWHIEFNPPPIPSRNCDWQFWHDDFDGAEDSGDNRCGSAESLEAAKAEIDEREAEAVTIGFLAALQEIADSHIPDQPAHDAGDELSWAQRHVGKLRGIALLALRRARGEQ
jgi:hypothetical protein